MSARLLDTNVVSQFVKGKAPGPAREKLGRLSPDGVLVSIVSRAEILFGLARIGNPPRLSHAVAAFFMTAEVCEWDEDAAQAYARLRTGVDAKGLGVAPLDLMIAAHALALGAVLVTNDTALRRLTPWLPVEDWTQ